MVSLSRFKPAVRTHWLLLASGILWTGAAAILETFAYNWLSTAPVAIALPLAFASLLLALAIERFGFSRITFRNTQRIGGMSRKVCVFAFQEWHSYFVMCLMIGLGILLRESEVPKPLLALVYAGIGGALFLSSCQYYGHFLNSVFKRQAA